MDTGREGTPHLHPGECVRGSHRRYAASDGERRRPPADERHGSSVGKGSELPPGGGDLLDRLLVDGRFGVGSGQFTDPGVQEKLDALSRARPAGQREYPERRLRYSGMMRVGKVRSHSQTWLSTFPRRERATARLIQSSKTRSWTFTAMERQEFPRARRNKSFLLKIFDPFFGKETHWELHPGDRDALGPGLWAPYPVTTALCSRSGHRERSRVIAPPE